jgi:hypothetical protein
MARPATTIGNSGDGDAVSTMSGPFVAGDRLGVEMLGQQRPARAQVAEFVVERRFRLEQHQAGGVDVILATLEFTSGFGRAGLGRLDSIDQLEFLIIGRTPFAVERTDLVHQRFGLTRGDHRAQLPFEAGPLGVAGRSGFFQFLDLCLRLVSPFPFGGEPAPSLGQGRLGGLQRSAFGQAGTPIAEGVDCRVEILQGEQFQRISHLSPHYVAGGAAGTVGFGFGAAGAAGGPPAQLLIGVAMGAVGSGAWGSRLFGSTTNVVFVLVYVVT